MCAADASRPALAELLARTAASQQDTVPLDWAAQAIAVARDLVVRSRALQTPQERRQQAELNRMMEHPEDKATLVQITDQAFRSERAYRVADQLTHILDVQGVPRFFSPFDRTLLRGFQSFGSYLPGVAVPLVKDKMHRETANVVLPAEPDMLAEHLRARRAVGIRMNVNFLGEALLGEEEAESRISLYLHALGRPEIEVLSVKISTIYSQIWPLAWEHTIQTLCERLEWLYRAAAKARFVPEEGPPVPKFVYLDMEEYRDLAITAEAFIRTLDRPGLEHAHAGIALQAYVPDSFLVQQRLNAWARRRVAQGKAPITIRLVKGANMEMERFEAVQHGWPQAPYRTKVETDANYKCMLREGLRAENIQAVRLGIASHNLFDVALGMVWAAEADALDKVQFEMLEGMANHQRRAVADLHDNLLLYAPACRHEDFLYAIGYLIRRLDENTGADNFLRHTFKLELDSPEWQQLQRGFLEACQLMDSVSHGPRRTQNRQQEEASPMPVAPPEPALSMESFSNESPTDFALPANITWATQVVDRWRRRTQHVQQIPLVIDGVDILERPTADCIDPSRPGVVIAQYREATPEDVHDAVACGVADPDGWRQLPPAERARLLQQVAREVRQERGELMGAALAETGKILTESDPEVCEAIDFLEFYSRSAAYFCSLEGLKVSGRGLVAVVSPWNFPIAIACGGIASALAAGNTVILKPALESVLVARLLCECFWRAGVSPRTLQFLTGPDLPIASSLVGHPQVDTVVLTGGTSTAQAILAARPETRLLAETGGKNATIVTGMADRDLAIKQLLQSAFSHSGQKCSATSLLLLEAEVFDDLDFRHALVDAVESLHVGSAWDLRTRIGPLIRPPSGPLEAGFKELEPEEEWAVLPHQREDNPHLYSPGVKWNVQPGTMTHTTEMFGPVLGVMKFRHLEEAVARVNETGYGLTSGLQSLDDREQQTWKQTIQAGNLYINRPTTGAIVLRQPFGGFGLSCFGPGLKAGGPNYVVPLMAFAEDTAMLPLPGESSIQHPDLLNILDSLEQLDLSPEEVDRLRRALHSYDHWAREEFLREHDHFRLVGQDNIRRYLPAGVVRLRIEANDTAFDILARIAAARAVGCRVTVSSSPDDDRPLLQQLHEMTDSWAGAIEFLEQDDSALAAAVKDGLVDRLRYAAPDRVPIAVRAASAESATYIADAPILAHGRVELLWYVLEQSISFDYHRYGNLGARAGEKRAEST